MAKQLRIIFDFSCPYCYLAWGYFKKLRETVVLADDWFSWEIHPEVPKMGSPLQDVVQVADMVERKQRLNALGAPVGIAPGEKVFVPNTRLALCALEFAREQRKQHAWIDAVYQASFVGQKNISELAVLLNIAREINLDEAALRQALESDRYLPVLLDHDRLCLEQKIEWVPTVFAGETKIIEGAFSFAEFTAAMQEKVL
jgi:predicted DsbA family dithiol-disulfide isomerase